METRGIAIGGKDYANLSFRLWKASTAYVIGDTVYVKDAVANNAPYQLRAYRCITAHTSGADMVADIAKWAELYNHVVNDLTTGGTTKTLSAEMGKNVKAALGAVLSTAGAYVAHTGKNYINGNADVAADLIDLDAQIKVNADAIAGMAAGMLYQGVLIGTADLTAGTLATGNPAVDDDVLKKGDFFKISTDGNITLRDGTLEVKTGDMIIVNKDIADVNNGTTGAALADIDKIDNTEAVDILRTGDLAAAQIFVGNAGGVATAVAMSGQATISNAGAITLDNAAVIAKVLTGYTPAAGNPAATDSILQALQKIDGNVDAVNTLSGAAQGAVNLGTFTGSIIADNVTIKAALQALETDAEALQTAVGIAAEAVNLGTFTGGVIPDNVTVKAALQALETKVEAHDTFIEHSDTPAAYAANAYKVARVNAAANAMEFGHPRTVEFKSVTADDFTTPVNTQFWRGTRAAYDAIGAKNAATIYFIGD